MLRGNSESNVIAFCHIPKTAGTSLNLSLRRYFGSALLAARHRKNVATAHYREADFERDSLIYRKLRCISGHGIKPWANFGKFENALHWFTFLRQPHKRFVSLYVHQQTNKVAEKKMDLLSWSEQFDRADGMVKMIAGEKNLAKAIDIIETKIQFVGLAEHYLQSLQLLASYFELDGFPCERQGRQMTSRNFDLAASIFAQPEKYGDCIESNNVLDMQLYQYVVDNVWPRQLASIALNPQLNDSIGWSKSVKQRVDYARFQIKDKALYQPLLKFGFL